MCRNDYEVAFQLKLAENGIPCAGKLDADGGGQLRGIRRHPIEVTDGSRK